MSEYIDMLKGFVGDVDSSVLENLGEKATSVFKGFGKTDDFINTVQTNRLAESATTINDSPILKDAFMNISFISNVKNVVTIILIIWALALIVIDIVPFIDETVKEKFKYINKVFFGDLGFIPMIFILWISVIMINVFIPSVGSVTPKVNDLLSNINSMFKAIFMK